MESELLAGKVALVTGSTRGMGRGIARCLARAGADLMLHDEDARQAARFGEAAGPEEVLAEIEALGRRAAVVFGDLRLPEAARAAAAAAHAQYGRLDVLVNCAGGDIGAATARPEPNDCLGIADADLEAVVGRNLLSVLHMSRAAAPAMIEQGGGSIVNIASVAGLIPATEGSVYAVAKAGVIHWTKCLAAHLRPHGISVNCISPGATKTARFFATRAVPAARLSETRRLLRLGEPEDIARVCLFLASDLASFVTGQNIEVSGTCR